MRNIVKPAHSKRDDQLARTRIDSLLSGPVDKTRAILKERIFLHQAEELVEEAIEAREAGKIAELDRSRPERKVAARRRQTSEQVGRSL